jgi:hypothetical protein
MPRAPDPANITHQEEQARYRARLAEERVPEATAVDVAAAAALAAYAALERRKRVPREDRKVIARLLEATVSILVAKGFSESASKRVAKRRLARGFQEQHLSDLIEMSGLDAENAHNGVSSNL